MDMMEFERAVKDRGFAVGDSFWINGVEFEVITRRETTTE